MKDNKQLTENDIRALLSDESKDVEYRDFKEKIQEHLVKYFKNQDFTPCKNDLKERLYKMIDYAIGRFDYYSNQKHRFLTFGLSFIGFSATLLGILLNNNESINNLILTFGYLGFLTIFVTGLLMLFVFNKYTTPNYPYRKIMNIKSWFFKYKFSDTLDYKLSCNKEKSDRQLVEVAENYLQSVYEWIEYSKIKNFFIKEDFEQVAVLHLLQKYSRDCVKKMRNIMNWGLGIFISLFIILILVEILFRIFC